MTTIARDSCVIYDQIAEEDCELMLRTFEEQTAKALKNGTEPFDPMELI